MMHLKRILFLLLFTLVYIKAIADPNKQALKFLLEGSYEKAESQIIKSISKDSVNSGGHYLYSLLFVQETFERFNIDSAYYHILTAKSHWDIQDEKELSKLSKIGVNLDTIDIQREKIEVLAFNRAVETMSLGAFDYFFENFNNVTLNQRLIITRDSLAYSQTTELNTWQAYNEFALNYPKSLQKSSALKKFHDLVYLEKAKDKNLDELEEFLKEIPRTPYRVKVEEEILRWYTLDNLPASYKRFISNYPTSSHKKRVNDILFHVTQMTDERGDFGIDSDSLQMELNAVDLKLVPYIKENRFGFFTTTGDEFLSSRFSGISDQTKCNIRSGALLLVEKDQENMLISKTGQEIIVGFDEYKALSEEVYQITYDGRSGAILANGERLLKPEFESVELVDDKFFVATSKDGKYLYSFLGKRLLPTAIDGVQVIRDGRALMISKNEKIALFRIDDLNKGLIDPADLEFIYDEIEALETGFLLCFSGDNESLLNNQLVEIIPRDEHEIYVDNELIYVKSEWGIQIFNESKQKLSAENYQNILIDEKRIAIKHNNSWSLFFDNLLSEPITGIDSLYFLNANATITVESASKKMIFDNGKLLSLAGNETIQVVKNSLNDEKTSYLVLKGDRDVLTLIDSFGQELFSKKALGISYASDSLFILKNKNGFNLVDEKGSPVIKGDFDLLDPAMQNGVLIFHLLEDNKLGIYNSRSRVKISPKYGQKLTLINDSLFVVEKEGLKGILDTNNKKKDVFIHDDIKILSETLILVKEDGAWYLLNLETDEVLLENIIQLDEIANLGDRLQIKYRQLDGYGIIDSKAGVLLPGIYNEILNLDQENDPFYYVERYLKDSGFYIILYVNDKGEKVISKAYREDEYSQILCED